MGDEKIVYKGKIHWFTLLPGIVGIILSAGIISLRSVIITLVWSDSFLSNQSNVDALNIIFFI